MAGFTKLFSSIVTSSIWCEDDKTFRVWIAMLALADATGHVDGSIPGIARLTGISIPEMEHAIERLTSPDPYSRTPEYEGRRIAPEPGGWKVLNYSTYREKGQAKDGTRAEYMRQYRAGRGSVTGVTGVSRVTERNSVMQHVAAPASASASASPREACTSKEGSGTGDWADTPPMDGVAHD